MAVVRHVISLLQDAAIGFGGGRELFQRYPLVRRMRLRDVARSVHERGQARAREQRRLGPEIDGVADGQAELVGQVARGKALGFRGGPRNVSS